MERGRKKLLLKIKILPNYIYYTRINLFIFFSRAFLFWGEEHRPVAPTPILQERSALICELLRYIFQSLMYMYMYVQYMDDTIIDARLASSIASQTCVFFYASKAQRLFPPISALCLKLL